VRPPLLRRQACARPASTSRVSASLRCGTASLFMFEEYHIGVNKHRDLHRQCGHGGSGHLFERRATTKDCGTRDAAPKAKVNSCRFMFCSFTDWRPTTFEHRASTQGASLGCRQRSVVPSALGSPIAGYARSHFGPKLPTLAMQQISGYLRYTGRAAKVIVKAALDRSGKLAWSLSRWAFAVWIGAWPMFMATPRRLRHRQLGPHPLRGSQDAPPVRRGL
jgi:hypothetical protein